MTSEKNNNSAQEPNGVILPKTDFSLRAGMAEKSKEFIEHWDKFDLWAKLREQSADKPKFILHDGPPYANGHLHMGHALNKILKDIINRAQQMRGFDAHYIPGWDCHGLPIEWKVEEEYRAQGKNKDEVSIAEFRAECRQFAEKWIEVQKQEFAQLGLLGDWQNPYQTMDYASEARIAKEIGKFLVSGNLNQSARPVLWSIAEKTALADAEVEYHQHSSQAIFVAFPLSDNACEKLKLDEGTAILIWTTTPWTIPANRAIALNEDFTYWLVRDDTSGLKFLIEETCLARESEARGWVKDAKEKSISGAKLAGLLAKHPLANHPQESISAGYRYDVPLLAAEFVTREQGSGFVHCAPSHGEDDFRLGQKHGLPCENTVDEDGYYTSAIPGFEGARIYDENGKPADANKRVLEALAESNMLLEKYNYKHDYPHSWRSKTPLIFRNTSQWFIRMDWRAQGKTDDKVNSNKADSKEQSLREKALAEIERVAFFPKEGKKRLHDMIASRPDWCVSRQRLWGVPLPIFTHKQSGDVLREQSVIDKVVEIFAREGAGSWYQRPAQDFLPAGYKADDYQQCQDIVEVWFDSGSTHAFVLEERLGLDCADLYLEGSDQHRGWFHSSLLQACGTKGKAPYKAVLTHGFVLDERGRKMSKSLGNITAPQKVLKKYGPDILRLWVAGSNYTGDLLIGEEILKSHADMYRRFRNTLRFLLGNLEEKPPEEKPITLDIEKLPLLERVLLAQLVELDEFLERCISNHNYTPYINALYEFCNSKLSNWYFDIRKDCLYCDGKRDKKRQQCLAVMEVLFEFLTRRLAPILCFTAEEAFQSLRRKRGEDNLQKSKLIDSIHLQAFVKVQQAWKNEELAQQWQKFVNADDWSAIVNSDIDKKRKEGQLGSSLEARLVFPYGDVNTWNTSLKDLGIVGSAQETDDTLGDILAEIFIVSDVKLDRKSQSTVMNPRVEKITDWQKCERCWKFVVKVDEANLCSRCANVVEQAEVP